jgi:hypothetical protein
MYPFAKQHSDELDYVERTADISVTTLADFLVGGTVQYDGATRVLLELFGGIPNLSNNGIVYYLYQDGAAMCRWIDYRLGVSSGTVTGNQSFYLPRYYTPGAGKHQYSIKAAATTGTVVVNCGDGVSGSSVYAPAFFRISVA